MNNYRKLLNLIYLALILFFCQCSESRRIHKSKKMMRTDTYETELLLDIYSKRPGDIEVDVEVIEQSTQNQHPFKSSNVLSEEISSEVTHRVRHTSKSGRRIHKNRHHAHRRKWKTTEISTEKDVTLRNSNLIPKKPVKDFRNDTKIKNFQSDTEENTESEIPEETDGSTESTTEESDEGTDTETTTNNSASGPTGPESHVPTIGVTNPVSNGTTVDDNSAASDVTTIDVTNDASAAAIVDDNSTASDVTTIGVTVSDTDAGTNSEVSGIASEDLPNNVTSNEVIPSDPQSASLSDIASTGGTDEITKGKDVSGTTVSGGEKSNKVWIIVMVVIVVIILIIAICCGISMLCKSRKPTPEKDSTHSSGAEVKALTTSSKDLDKVGSSGSESSDGKEGLETEKSKSESEESSRSVISVDKSASEKSIRSV